MLVMFDVTCPREGVRTMTTAGGKGEVIDLNSKLCAPANLPIAVCTRKISVLVVPNHYISPVLKPEVALREIYRPSHFLRSAR